MATAPRQRDPAMLAAKERFDASGLTLQQLGVAMGFSEATARQAAFQFLDKVDDPKLGTLRKCAAALGVPVEELVAARPAGGKKAKGK